MNGKNNKFVQRNFLYIKFGIPEFLSKYSYKFIQSPMMNKNHGRLFFGYNLFSARRGKFLLTRMRLSTNFGDLFQLKANKYKG